MRSYSDVNVLILLTLVVALSAVMNFTTAFVILEWVCEGALSFLQQAAAFVGWIA
jgi:hypothetical protein